MESFCSELLILVVLQKVRQFWKPLGLNYKILILLVKIYQVWAILRRIYFCRELSRSYLYFTSDQSLYSLLSGPHPPVILFTWRLNTVAPILPFKWKPIYFKKIFGWRKWLLYQKSEHMIYLSVIRGMSEIYIEMSSDELWRLQSPPAPGLLEEIKLKWEALLFSSVFPWACQYLC